MWRHLAGCLPAAGPVALVLDLRISHERWGNSSNPSVNGQLRYPADLDRTLNEAAADKNLQYRAHYNNRPSDSISFMPAMLVLQDAYTVSLCAFYFCRLIGKLTDFLPLQEFSLRNPTTSISTVARCSPHSSSRKWDTSLPRLQPYVLI